MCGLFGVASTERMREYKARQGAFFDGVWMNTLRGDHSTGIAAIPIGEETKEPRVFKKAMSGPDFLSLQKAQDMIRDIEKWSMLIAHNRAATQGLVQHENAHPFVADHITLTHNGHVNNAFSLSPLGKTGIPNVDSAHVAHAMAVKGEKEALEQLQGNYALVWHNSKDGTLNFARNHGRPLKFCFVKDENTMWWMSERVMLVSVLDRNNVKIDGPFYSVPENLWFKFKVDNLREYETIPFVNRPSAPRRAAGHDGHQAGGTSPVPSTAGTGSTQGTQPGTKADFLRGAKIAAAQGKLIASIMATMDKPEKTEIDRRVWITQKNSCRPKGAKRIEKTNQRLGALGFHYNQFVAVDVSGWKVYSNQKNLGSMSGMLVNTGIGVHLSSMTIDQYEGYRKHKVLLAQVVNAKPDKTGVQALVVEVHPLAAEFDKEWIKRWSRIDEQANRRAVPGSSPRPQIGQAVKELLCLPSPEPEGLSDAAAGEKAEASTGRSVEQVVGPNGNDSVVILSHGGPRGTHISAGQYAKLTKTGCAICDAVFTGTIEESNKVFWVEDEPICFKCSENGPLLTQYFGTDDKSKMH